MHPHTIKTLCSRYVVQSCYMNSWTTKRTQIAVLLFITCKLIGSLFVLVYYVYNYLSLFDCSCLFADFFSLFSKFICLIISYFILPIGMWYELFFD